MGVNAITAIGRGDEPQANNAIKKQPKKNFDAIGAMLNNFPNLVNNIAPGNCIFDKQGTESGGFTNG